MNKPKETQPIELTEEEKDLIYGLIDSNIRKLDDLRDKFS